MPVSVHHGVLFVFVFVLLVSLMLATVYTLVTGMVVDAYRYERALERANEKLRLVAALSEGTLYYGVRNIALTTVDIRELGVVDVNGGRHVLARGVTLEPGEAYTGREVGVPVGVLYAVTARGNVFTAPVLRLGGPGALTFTLRSLAPACIQAESPVSYGGPFHYTIGFCTYAYVFGFLVVDDPWGDANTRLVLGPVNVARLLREARLPFTTSTYGGSGPLYARATLTLTVEGGAGRTPHYRVSMPVEVSRTDGARGLLVYGCLGVIWRTITSTVVGLDAGPRPLSYCGTLRDGGRVCDTLGVYVAPSALDVGALIAHMARGWRPSHVEAPSGTQVYIVLARCFRVESAELKSVTTSTEKPYTRIGDTTIHTYLDLPGVNKVDRVDMVLRGAHVTLHVDPELIIHTILDRI